jgi:small subunit ribosomal protein S7
MPRRREVPKREILPDPKFGNVELSKFMNVIMEGGKKAVAERIIYGALDLIEKKHPARTRWKLRCCHQQRQAHG